MTPSDVHDERGRKGKAESWRERRLQGEKVKLKLQKLKGNKWHVADEGCNQGGRSVRRKDKRLR